MDFKDKAKKLADKFPAKTEDTFYSTGSVIFDAVLGGGIPAGSYIEIASKSGLGKSTMVLHACRYACSQGYSVIYLDFEQAVNESQIDGIGLTPYLDDNFFWYQPVTFTDAEEIIDELGKEEELAFIVFDSIKSMLPDKMTKKSVEDIQPGLHARLVSNFLLKYKSLVRRRGISLIYITQMRYKLNFRGKSSKKAAGGQAQQFFSDIRVRMGEKKKLKKVEKTLEGEEKIPYGAHVGIWTIKNRYERPYVEAVMTILYGKGISNISAYYRWLTKEGYVKSPGAGWYNIEMGDIEERVRGEDELYQWVRENKEIVKEFIENNGGFLLVEDTEE